MKRTILKEILMELNIKEILNVHACISYQKDVYTDFVKEFTEKETCSLYNKQLNIINNVLSLLMENPLDSEKSIYLNLTNEELEVISSAVELILDLLNSGDLVKLDGDILKINKYTISLKTIQNIYGNLNSL